MRSLLLVTNEKREAPGACSWTLTAVNEKTVPRDSQVAGTVFIYKEKGGGMVLVSPVLKMLNLLELNIVQTGKNAAFSY